MSEKLSDGLTEARHYCLPPTKEDIAAAAALEADVAELTKRLAITVKQYEDAERAI